MFMIRPVFPADTKFFDVDGIAVARLPGGEHVAVSVGGSPSAGVPRPYPNSAKVFAEGDALSADEFASWIDTGRNRFDVAPAAP
jgi:hypothetical protein